MIAFLDHDDLITPPDCLAEIAIYYSDHPEADIVYSDDDKIDLTGPPVRATIQAGLVACPASLIHVSEPHLHRAARSLPCRRRVPLGI